MLVEGEGFEPSKAVPSDLQSDPFDRSGTPPSEKLCILDTGFWVVKHYWDFLSSGVLKFDWDDSRLGTDAR